MQRPLGVVYTKDWVADFVLDLAGYVVGPDILRGTIVEPACGDGAFLLPIVARLLTAARKYGVDPNELDERVRAFDIAPEAVVAATTRVLDLLAVSGVDGAAASRLAAKWIRESDYLTDTSVSSATWVVGNPPYVRTRSVDPKLLKMYRDLWPLMSGRSDLYVAFYQKGLDSLVEGGTLAFLCTDRWMKNQYGSGLRRLIADDFALRTVVELSDVEVFEKRVATYPALTVISRATSSPVTVARANRQFDAPAAARLTSLLSRGAVQGDNEFGAYSSSAIVNAGEHWPLARRQDLRLLETLNRGFETLPESDVVVGSGMATGADEIFIVSDPAEFGGTDALSAMIAPADLADGEVQLGKRYLLNPWDADGRVRSLSDLPEAVAAHFQKHEARLKNRYVARSNPAAWWRTIDKPRSEYLKPKLILADIKNRIEPVLDVSGAIPMHSLYYLSSEVWDLRALGGLLLSDAVERYVRAYSVGMASGAIRVSAQYLRMVRLPKYADLTAEQVSSLSKIFLTRDRDAASAAARDIFGLTED